MSEVEIQKIISIDRIKHNKVYIQIEKILEQERKREVEIGKKIFKNRKQPKRVATYFRFNTQEKYEQFYLHIYENRLFRVNGGMLYV